MPVQCQNVKNNINDCGFIYLEAWSHSVITMAKPSTSISSESGDASLSGNKMLCIECQCLALLSVY